MLELISFGLLCFTSFLTLINPLAIVPLFLTMTKDVENEQRKRIARKSILIATIAILSFAFGGELIFLFFNISINSLKIVGGVIFLSLGMDMLHARLGQSKVDLSDVKVYANDISVTPLAIPMLCGPGVITNAMVLWSSCENIEYRATLIASILLVMLISLLVISFASKISNFLGETGNKVMMRLMGLIVMVIAIEFFVAGFKPIAVDIAKMIQSTT